MADATVPRTSSPLRGKWKKSSAGRCGERYPDEIEFFDRPRYLGARGPEQRFVVWDAGDYEVLDGARVRIQTATDEHVTYRYFLSEDEVAFLDREGCEFRYRRLE